MTIEKIKKNKSNMDNFESECNNMTKITGTKPIEPDVYCESGDGKYSPRVIESVDCTAENHDMRIAERPCSLKNSNSYALNASKSEIEDCVDGLLMCMATNPPSTSVDNANNICERPQYDSPIMKDIRRAYAPFNEITDSFHTSTFVLTDNLMGFVKLIMEKENNPNNMFPHERIEEMRECIKDYLMFDMDVYLKLLDTLRNYGAKVIDFKCGKDIFSPDFYMILASLMKENLLPDELLSQWYRLNKTCDKMTNCVIMDVHALIVYMEDFEEMGLMSQWLLDDIRIWARGLEGFTETLSMITKEKKAFYENVHKIVTENCSLRMIDTQIKTSKVDKRFKTKVCGLEHNKPLCPNCGLRNSWLKAFRKRGVYVSEAANSSKGHVWINNVIT